MVNAKETGDSGSVKKAKIGLDFMEKCQNPKCNKANLQRIERHLTNSLECKNFYIDNEILIIQIPI